MFSTIYDKKRAQMPHRHPFHHVHQSFANYGTDTMQKTELRDFGDDLLHNLHKIPDPLKKNLADTIISSENRSNTQKKVEEVRKMSEEKPKEIPTVQTSPLSGILSYISSVFHSVSGAMFRPRSPVYYDCFTDGDWHYSNTEQDKIGTESPVHSSDMNTDTRSAVAACEGKLNQVRYLLSSPRPISSVWIRKRPKKTFIEPGSVEESFEDAFSPEDIVNLPNDSFIEYYTPFSYQNDELFETAALKTKLEEPIAETTDIITIIDENKQKGSLNEEPQMLQPRTQDFKTKDSMKSENQITNNINSEIEQESLKTETVSNIKQDTVRQKSSLNSVTTEPLTSKDEVDYVTTDKNQLITSCEDKLSKLKALLCKNKRNHNQTIKTSEPETTKPILDSKTVDKHYKNPHRRLDKRRKTKLKNSIQDDILFANEIDCADTCDESPINTYSTTCLGDFFDEITGRFRTTSNNSDDSFQIVFNDTPRVRLSSDCESEDSFIVFEDSPDSCYTSNDVFGDSDSETESEVSDSGCSTLTCKLSHTLSRTVSNLTDDSLYAESGDENDYSNIEKVIKCDEIYPNYNELSQSHDIKSRSNEFNQLLTNSNESKDFECDFVNRSHELSEKSDEVSLRSDEINYKGVKKTGLLLDEDRKRRRRDQPAKKVHFSQHPPKVHLMRVWSFAARQARAGHWERYAVDRERFKRRIADVDMAVSWVLKPQHRARIKFQRFMPWWNQQRRAELAEKKKIEEQHRAKQEELYRITEELVMQEHEDVRKLEEEEERIRQQEEYRVRQEELSRKRELINHEINVVRKLEEEFIFSPEERRTLNIQEQDTIINQEEGLKRQEEIKTYIQDQKGIRKQQEEVELNIQKQDTIRKQQEEFKLYQDEEIKHNIQKQDTTRKQEESVK